MNARVFLLVLMTGMFMALWNSDQAAMQAALARRAQASASAIASRNSGVQPVLSGRSDAMRTVAQAHELADAAESAVSAVVPLPVDLPVGDYQAVSQTGQTVRISIDANSQNSGHAVQIRDMYLSETPGGVRWYIVRVNSQQSVH